MQIDTCKIHSNGNLSTQPAAKNKGLGWGSLLALSHHTISDRNTSESYSHATFECQKVELATIKPKPPFAEMYQNNMREKSNNQSNKQTKTQTVPSTFTHQAIQSLCAPGDARAPHANIARPARRTAAGPRCRSGSGAVGARSSWSRTIHRPEPT